MNNNDVGAIQNGLMQYVGALIESTDREGAEAMHVALAKLSETWLGCCKKEDGSYDMFIAKPILRAAALLVKSYNDELRDAVKEQTYTPPSIKEVINDNDTAVKVLSELVDSIKEHNA